MESTSRPKLMYMRLRELQEPINEEIPEEKLERYYYTFTIQVCIFFDGQEYVIAVDNDPALTRYHTFEDESMDDLYVADGVAVDTTKRDCSRLIAQTVLSYFDVNQIFENYGRTKAEFYDPNIHNSFALELNIQTEVDDEEVYTEGELMEIKENDEFIKLMESAENTEWINHKNKILFKFVRKSKGLMQDVVNYFVSVS